MTKIKNLMSNQYFSGIMNKIKKHDIFFSVLVLVIYRLLLDMVYIIAINPTFAAFSKMDFSIVRYAISLLTLCIFILPTINLYKQKLVSSIIVLLLNLWYFIPMTTMYAFYNFDTEFYILGLIYWSILMFCQFKLPVLYIKKVNPKFNNIIMYFFIISMSIVVLFVSAKYTGFRITFDFINVYGIRAEASTYNIPTIIQYMLFMAGIGIPLFLLYAFEHKKKFLSLFLLIIWLLNFSIAAHKTVFIMLFLAILGYLFYRERFINLFAIAMTCMLIVLSGIYIVFENVVPIGILISRVMLIPIQLSYHYYEFFNENNLNLFRNGILGKFGFSEIYSQEIPYIIGEFTEKINTSFSMANNGLLGDVFANTKYIGIFIMPIILVIIFRLLDSVSKNLDKKIVVVICIYFANSFINMSWSTVLLTQGYLMICLLIYFYPSINNKEEIKNEV